MRVAVYSTKPYDKKFLDEQNPAGATPGQLAFEYLEARLDAQTALLATGRDAICIFVNDVADEQTLRVLAGNGVRLIALRCAGFNNVDLKAAASLGLSIARVPRYSPYAVAEHTVGLMLALNRQIHRAYNRVRERNFALEGLLGFDMYQRTVGVVGTGQIGAQTARILLGFGCRVLAHDLYIAADLEQAGVKYVDLASLLRDSDIVTLHCPLTSETHHLINADTLATMKHGVMLINTSRGGLLDTRAVLKALKAGRIGYLGLDVYEEEGDLFFEDRSGLLLQDDVFARLLTFSNVIVTGHQAFFTREALQRIAEVTIGNLIAFEKDGAVPIENQVKL
ncbi:MAG: 2-hydroxyacid dehydrogenase [Candidatus Sumerlaeaceae bacterium]